MKSVLQPYLIIILGGPCVFFFLERNREFLFISLFQVVANFFFFFYYFIFINEKITIQKIKKNKKIKHVNHSNFVYLFRSYFNST